MDLRFAEFFARLLLLSPNHHIENQNLDSSDNYSFLIRWQAYDPS